MNQPSIGNRKVSEEKVELDKIPRPANWQNE